MVVSTTVFFWFTAVAHFVGADGGCSQCSTNQPAISAPYHNIWSGLSAEEISDVARYVKTELSSYNLTEPPGGSRDNTIVQIDLLRPNKTDVLPFIVGSSEPPTRYSRVMISIASVDQPYFQEYMVGPLPVGTNTDLQPLTFPYNNKTPGKLNVPAAYIGDDIAKFISDFQASVDNITRSLWNLSSISDVFLHLATPFTIEGNETHAWADFVNGPTTPFDSPYLLPLGLFVQFNLTSHNSSQWGVIGWFYNGLFYESTEVFQKALEFPGFVKLPANVDGNWTSTDKTNDNLAFDDFPPPALISQGSKRFLIDYKENYVSWMDFTFYISINRDTGLRLFDVRYKGKRILYELGLEEAFTHYAGYDPVQSGTTYFDTQSGFGAAIVPLVDGYDCPTYSTYLNASWSDGGQFKTQVNSICLFEIDTGHPIQRHAGAGYTSVTKNIAFTVRSISTIGNYDFLTSYNFHLDGSMEVSVRASGYIQSAYYAQNEDYGFRIHDNLSGSMHDHVLTFKADFDILGVRNSLQKIEVVPATVEYPWARGKPRNTMKLVKSFIETEDQGKINWEPNHSTMYAVVNRDTPNKYGESPGYRFKPATGTVHLTVKNSSNAINAGHYATEDFYVTRQKDTEVQASHPNNGLNPIDPLVDFSKFFDGESLDQEDLVIWFNLGMHHVPNTADIPNTVFTTAHSALTIEPFNYLESDASRATSQQIRINYQDGKVSSVQRFGAQPANCSVDLSAIFR